jgi:hypothetical protein
MSPEQINPGLAPGTTLSPRAKAQAEAQTSKELGFHLQTRGLLTRRDETKPNFGWGAE